MFYWSIEGTMKYRKKPVTIEAIQWTGKNKEEIKKFVKTNMFFSDIGELYIYTLEGKMCASIGDYIICDVDNEFYPCKPDIFEKTYERVTSEK